MKIHTEKTLEDAIEAHLLAHGWLQGHDDDFSPGEALDRRNLFAFLRATQGETWAALRQSPGDALEDKVVTERRNELASLESTFEDEIRIEGKIWP